MPAVSGRSAPPRGAQVGVRAPSVVAQPPAGASAGRSSRRSRRRRRRRRASRWRSPRRGGGPGSPWWGTSRPTSGRSGRAAWSRPQLVGEALAPLDERRDAGRALGLGLAGVGVVLADVRGHRRLRCRTRGRRQVGVSAAATGCARGYHSAPAAPARWRRVGGSADRRQARAPGIGRGREGPARRRAAVHELDRVLVARGRRRTATRARRWPSAASPASTPVAASPSARTRDRRREPARPARP